MMTSIAQALRRIAGSSLCLCLVELDMRRVLESGGFRTAFTAMKQDKDEEDETAATTRKGNVEVDIVYPVLRTLVDRALDVLVLVHDAGGRVEGRKRVAVEVVKDERVGVACSSDGNGNGDSVGEDGSSALGRWAVWQR